MNILKKLDTEKLQTDHFIRPLPPWAVQKVIFQQYAI